MKINLLVTLYSALTASVAAQLDMETVVGKACENDIDYGFSFHDDSGESCTSCDLCEGSLLGSIFDSPKSFCIKCNDSEDKCATFKVTTTFKNPWAIKSLFLMASDMAMDSDPASIALAGSNDGKSWTTMFSTDDLNEPLFKDREAKETHILANSKQYSRYAMSYKLKKASTTMYLGTCSILQVYTRQCAAEVFSDVTNINILPYDTTAPTDAPTEPPTNPPVINVAMEGTATQSTTHKPYTKGCCGAEAKRAIDGNTSGIWNDNALSSTDKATLSTWTLKLKKNAYITNIVIWQRTEKHWFWLNNAKVIISSDDKVTEETLSVKSSKPITLPVNRVINQIEVQFAHQHLQLAEVQAFGYYVD